nr:BspA family leucine-rich repeat surface protein [Campylobacter sp. RKI_CA19_01122]
MYNPKTKSELKALVDDLNTSLKDINVSNIQEMDCLFKNSKRKDFSGIEEWDVSNVTSMNEMFYGCKKINQNLNNWDTTKVINISYMFSNCFSFNQALDKWDVSNVLWMEYVFFVNLFSKFLFQKLQNLIKI